MKITKQSILTALFVVFVLHMLILISGHNIRLYVYWFIPSIVGLISFLIETINKFLET